MSSTAIVIPMLVESKRLHSGAGRASLAVLLFQDLAVAPLLVMTGALSAAGDTRPCVATPHHARSGGACPDRPCRLRPARVAAVLPFRRGNKEPRVLHGGVPSGRARRWAGRRGEPSVDGARRLRRRAPAGGDRISPRDRSDDRAVSGPPARALLPFGWGHDQSGVHPRATRAYPWSRRGAGGGEGV